MSQQLKNKEWHIEVRAEPHDAVLEGGYQHSPQNLSPYSWNTEAIRSSETSTHIYKATWRHNVFNKRPDRGSGMHGACGPANDLRARVHSVVFQNWRTAE